MTRLRLRFDDQDLEASFRAKQAGDVLPSVRLGLVAELLLTVAFVGVAALVADRDLVGAETIHGGHMVVMAVLLWTTRRPWWPAVQPTALTVATVVTAWTWSVMSIVGGYPSLYMALATPLLMVWLATLFRVGVARTATGALLLLPPLATTFAAIDASAETWVLTFAYLVNFYSLAVLAAYLLERGARRSFLQQRMIRRFAPPSVAAAIETGQRDLVDLPRRRRVTVLFSDVVGFTRTADSLDPEALAQIVQEYLATMATVIERHGGTLNEFAGDGVMAIFGAPDETAPEEQVANAVAAALAIRASMPVLSERWYRIGLDHELRTRVGINTGFLSVGTFGSDGRATYTGIGLQTNIAARIQALCEPGSVLLSQASWHLVKDTIACEERGEALVKGVHFPITMYEPIAT